MRPESPSFDSLAFVISVNFQKLLSFIFVFQTLPNRTLISRSMVSNYLLNGICAGRIYKLRRPSSKHLTTYSGYVSSNPTQGWGFPLINADTEEDDIDTNPGPISSTLSSSTGSGHWNKQIAPKKVGTASRFLGEILLLFFSSIKHPSGIIFKTLQRS